MYFKNIIPINNKRVILRQLSTRLLGRPGDVRIVEVGPRDGLQNEQKVLPAAVKIDFINRLSNTGLKNIEVTSFVSPKWVPQMGDNSEVFQGITKKAGVSYPVLVPNLKGFESALKVGAKEIALFIATSESFSQRNTNCSVAESIERFKPVAAAGLKAGCKVRGYISTIVGCPYEGKMKPSATAKLTEILLEAGCYEISLGDTIGVATPGSVENLLKEVVKVAPVDKLAVHFHDTYGQALSNILASLEFGISVVDSSVSGLGGCPYARGATGNAATEDIVYMLQGMGIETGIDLDELISAGRFISDHLGKPTESKVNRASRNIKSKSN